MPDMETYLRKKKANRDGLRKQIVQIKSWDEMERVYGLTLDRDINVHYHFTGQMEELMPPDRIIELEGIVWRPNERYSYKTCPDMIKRVLNKRPTQPETKWYRSK